MVKKIKLECESGFFLTAAFLIFVLASSDLLLFTIAVVFHELGHIGAVRLLGGRTEKITFRAGGVEISYNEVRKSYLCDMFIAAAGPCVSLFSALTAAILKRTLGNDAFLVFAGINFALFLINMLPCSGLDGGRILYSIISYFFSDTVGDHVLRVLNIAVLVLLLILGIYALIIFHNPTLAISAVMIFEMCCKTK